LVFPGVRRSGGLSLSGVGEPAYLDTAFAGKGFFSTLGVRPLLGRPFLPEENIAGNDAVAILSYALWQKQFHSDPDVIGRKILLDGAPNVVLAVMPESFQFPAPSRSLDAAIKNHRRRDPTPSWTALDQSCGPPQAGDHVAAGRHFTCHLQARFQEIATAEQGRKALKDGLKRKRASGARPFLIYSLKTCSARS
jgi:hypothetical protein